MKHDLSTLQKLNKKENETFFQTSLSKNTSIWLFICFTLKIRTDLLQLPQRATKMRSKSNLTIVTQFMSTYVIAGAYGQVQKFAYNFSYSN